jgi:hypothetical protein
MALEPLPVFVAVAERLHMTQPLTLSTLRNRRSPLPSLHLNRRMTGYSIASVAASS